MAAKKTILSLLAFVVMLGLTLGVIGDFLVRMVELKATATLVADDAEPTKEGEKIAYYVPPPAATAAPTVTMAPTRPATAVPTTHATATRASAQRAPTAVAVVATAAPRPDVRLVTSPATPTVSIPTPVNVGESYGMLPVGSPPTDRPAERQADLNLSLRGQVPVSATLGLIDYDGDTDGGAPQLAGLFSDRRIPTFTAAFRVYDWNWDCECRGALLTDPEVTLIGMRTTPGELIHLPGAGQELGRGYQALVLYADPARIAVKYTRTDNVKHGYTLHMESVSVDSNLLALYRQANAAGRGELPALRAGQAFAMAASTEIRVAIRDTGTFMDPRSRKDWWRAR